MLCEPPQDRDDPLGTRGAPVKAHVHQDVGDVTKFATKSQKYILGFFL